MVSTPAFAAPTDSQGFDINATVLPECSIQNPADVELGNLAINEDPGADALLLSQRITSDTQNIWISCNYTTQISMLSANKGLVTQSPVTDSQFTNKINYRVRLLPSVEGRFNGANSWATFTQNPKVLPQDHEFHDNASLSIEIPNYEYGNQNKRPVAGDYTDTVTITLGVN